MSIQDDEIQNDIMGEQFDLSCIEALAPILARIPDQEPRVIAREARYLAINDLGKTVKGVDSSGRKFDGELLSLMANTSRAPAEHHTFPSASEHTSTPSSTPSHLKP